MVVKRVLNSTLQCFLVILLSILSGCNKADGVVELPDDSDMTIQASVKNASGEVTPLTEGITLGLTTNAPHQYEAINAPYKLVNGVLVPVAEEIKLEGTDEDGNQCTYTSMGLDVYGPYTSSMEDFLLTPIYPSRPPDPPYPPYRLVELYFKVDTDQRSNGTSSSDLVWGQLSDFKGRGYKHSVVLSHKFCKVTIRLKSELGNDLSDAKVTLLSMLTGGKLRFSTGNFEVSGLDEYRADITTFCNPDGTFEAIVPPQTMWAGGSHMRVETGGKSYIFRNKGEKKLVAAAEYVFDLTVKDKGDLPFTIDVKYDNGKTMGDRLALPASEKDYDISMTEIPKKGDALTYTKIKIRNASGQYCWAKIENDDYSNKDVLYNGIVRAKIKFEENLSATPRSMVVEFYNVLDSKFVHKRVLVEQAPSKDYLTLSSERLQVDRWGHVYDAPQRLNVQSNKSWILENGAPDWVTVEGYNAGALKQDLRIIVKENATSMVRSGELRFLVDGVVVKTYSITQSIIENSSFTLRYELNLRYNTVNGNWHKIIPDLADFYASRIVIFAKYEDNIDKAAEIYSTNYPYGYVVDVPTSNQLVVDGFKSDYFIYPNYTGAASTIQGINSTVTGPIPQGLTFFRQIMFNLPIPAKVERRQKVVYTVTINNIKDTQSHDTATVTYEIINQ